MVVEEKTPRNNRDWGTEIGCAGEIRLSKFYRLVSCADGTPQPKVADTLYKKIGKNEDYDKWGIDILVKFRYDVAFLQL